MNSASEGRFRGKDAYQQCDVAEKRTQSKSWVDLVTRERAVSVKSGVLAEWLNIDCRV